MEQYNIFWQTLMMIKKSDMKSFSFLASWKRKLMLWGLQENKRSDNDYQIRQNSIQWAFFLILIICGRFRIVFYKFGLISFVYSTSTPYSLFNTEILFICKCWIIIMNIFTLQLFFLNNMFLGQYKTKSLLISILLPI